MWKTSRLVDVALAFGLLSLLWLATLPIGDPLFAGFYYYLAAWSGVVIIVQIVRAPPLFTTGAAIALTLTVVAYWLWQISLPKPQGLLGLGHLISLPGLGVAAFVAAVIARRRQMRPPAALALAFFSSAAGFTAAQLTACQSLLDCGRFSVFTSG